MTPPRSSTFLDTSLHKDVFGVISGTGEGGGDMGLNINILLLFTIDIKLYFVFIYISCYSFPSHVIYPQHQLCAPRRLSRLPHQHRLVQQPAWEEHGKGKLSGKGTSKKVLQGAWNFFFPETYIYIFPFHCAWGLHHTSPCHIQSATESHSLLTSSINSLHLLCTAGRGRRRSSYGGTLSASCVSLRRSAPCTQSVPPWTSPCSLSPVFYTAPCTPAFHSKYKKRHLPSPSHAPSSDSLLWACESVCVCVCVCVCESVLSSEPCLYPMVLRLFACLFSGAINQTRCGTGPHRVCLCSVSRC